MNEWMNGWMNGWMNKWMNGWMVEKFMFFYFNCIKFFITKILHFSKFQSTLRYPIYLFFIKKKFPLFFFVFSVVLFL